MTSSLTAKDWDRARVLLCRMEEQILAKLLDLRLRPVEKSLSTVANVTEADTIYEIDHLTESVILEWFETYWPREWPVQLIMEGLEDQGDVTFPRGTPAAETILRCIIDPIDGTRMIMYDKRAAWALAALAPQKGDDTTLQDIQVAAMTELPTAKQWRADQLSCVRGQGVVAQSINVFNRSRIPLQFQPLQTDRLEHGFGSLSKFFPEGREIVARIEVDVIRALSDGERGMPVFNDQYISTGGQFYELVVGHDLWLGDIRPIIFEALGLEKVLVCHPYDVCCMCLLEEAGCVIEQPDGNPVNAPLDTTSPVTWVGYANKALADRIRPVLQDSLHRALAAYA